MQLRGRDALHSPHSTTVARHTLSPSQSQPTNFGWAILQLPLGLMCWPEAKKKMNTRIYAYTYTFTHSDARTGTVQCAFGGRMSRQ